MDLYRQQILDHYKHPHNIGKLKHANAETTVYNSTCGDKITMSIFVSKKNGTPIISDIAFEGAGCAVSQASASLLTDEVKFQPISKVIDMVSKRVYTLLGTTLTPSRVKCALLPLEAMKKALVEWKNKNTV